MAKPTTSRLKKFINNAMLDIYTSGGKLRSIGIKRGYSKTLVRAGFSRKEQIQILNYLQDHPTIAKKVIGY